MEPVPLSGLWMTGNRLKQNPNKSGLLYMYRDASPSQDLLGLPGQRSDHIIWCAHSLLLTNYPSCISFLTSLGRTGFCLMTSEGSVISCLPRTFIVCSFPYHHKIGLLYLPHLNTVHWPLWPMMLHEQQLNKVQWLALTLAGRTT